jgi:hypothetical protein
MKRTSLWIALAAALTVAVPPLLADVKTQQKTTARLEGLLGTFMNRRLGDGTVSTVSVKGNRMSRVDDKGQMQIIDLTEQKIYTVEIKDKSYKVMTFAEMRKAMEDAAKAMQDQAKGMSQQDKDALADASKQLETDAEVKETGQHKTIAGKETREVVLTIMTHERGKRIDESGGFILQNDMWLADSAAALNEMIDFQTRFFKAVFEGVFTGADIQQTSMFSSLFPGYMKLSERMAAETKKLRGTSLASAMVFGTVKAGSSMDQVRQQLSQPPPQGGGGLRGLGRMMSGQSNASSTGFSRFLTTSTEFLSIENAVNPNDLVIPAGFKQK